MGEVMNGIGTVWTWMMEHLLYINLFLSVIIVFFQRRDPKAVWTWLLALYFIPIFGFVFYLLLCQDFHKSKMFKVKEVEDRLRYSVKTQEEVIRSYAMSLSDPLSRDYEDLVLYNLETSGAVLTVDNSVEILTDGVQKFADLREEMKKARHYIHIQYYIIKNDEVFNSMIPILIDKVREGVEVRILYDGMGGRFMPKRVWEELKKEGIKVGEFFPAFLGRLHLRVNYRNHRKIVVIDGRVGYVGGFNVGKEYISKDPKFGYWRDTHLKLYGGSVLSLQIRFALDWNYATKENLFKNAAYFDSYRDGIGMIYPEHPKAGQSPIGVQIIASGPDAANRQIRNNYLQLFHKAQKHIYIQTPYFVPDDAILSALRIAAESGVDVRLMIPCKPDHPFVYWATYSYVGDLLAAGARCYTYENGFLHAKGVMVDSRVSCYGTANMDIRSFELNFEVNATIYDEETTERLEQFFIDDLMHCNEVTKEVYAQRGLWIRMKEQCSRLLSPLL
ncbi:MAG: cardiolipin synthase [Clostridiaceae bacterium]|nr:cardiolipin synthase [Clostridiaceae bacterium]